MSDLVKREGKFYKIFSNTPFSGEVTGEIKGTLKNGLWDKEFLAFDENGQLLKKGTFALGQKKDLWITYSDGNVVAKGKYINNLKEGIWYTYKGTNLNSKGNYLNGLKDGIWEHYSGKHLSSKGNYLQGMKDGFWKNYSRGFTIDGQYLSYLQSEGKYLNGKREGVWKSYFSSKQLKSEGKFLNGFKEGKWKECHYNLSLMPKCDEGTYNKGKKVGFWVLRENLEISMGFFESGIASGNFKDGKRNGLWKSICSARKPKEVYNKEQLLREKCLQTSADSQSCGNRPSKYGAQRCEILYEMGKVIDTEITQ